MKKLFIFALICFSVVAQAGRFSSGSRSYSRSSYSRPTTVVHHTTVINNGGGYHSSGSGIVTGMIIGSALSQPRHQVVYVNNNQPQVVYADGQAPQAQQGNVVMVDNTNHTFMWFSLMVVVVVLFFMFAV